MTLNITQIAVKVEALKRRYQSRDARMADILEVRRGNLVNVFPERFEQVEIRTLTGDLLTSNFQVGRKPYTTLTEPTFLGEVIGKKSIGLVCVCSVCGST